jgi:predicted RNA binding protein YcfA (HicA-like mRNA interferase family)
MPMKPKEMIKLFEKNGWIKKRQTGSHVIMEKNGQVEPIPLHNKDLKKGTECTLLKRLKEV